MSGRGPSGIAIAHKRSGLGLKFRSRANGIGGAAGHEWADAWSSKRGITRRVGLYLRHPELGADRIRMAGGRGEIVLWAAAHHDAERWDSVGLPPEVVSALREADDD